MSMVESNASINELCHMTDVWRSGQEMLPKVLRWGKFMSKGLYRPQNTLQHTYAIMLLGNMVRLRLEPYLPSFDWFLLLDCLLVHDHGEGELKIDTLYHNKNNEQDNLEYESFLKRYRQLPCEAFTHFHKAFLLQFCLKNPQNFSPPARKIMSELAQHNRREALLFDLIERYDYLVYAWEQYQRTGDKFLLVGVADIQIPHINQLCQELPCFAEHFWTNPISEYLTGLVTENSNLVKEFKLFITQPDQ